MYTGSPPRHGSPPGEARPPVAAPREEHRDPEKDRHVHEPVEGRVEEGAERGGPPEAAGGGAGPPVEETPGPGEEPPRGRPRGAALVRSFGKPRQLLLPFVLGEPAPAASQALVETQGLERLVDHEENLPREIRTVAKLTWAKPIR